MDLADRALAPVGRAARAAQASDPGRRDLSALADSRADVVGQAVAPLDPVDRAALA